MSDDLAARLLAAIEEREQNIRQTMMDALHLGPFPVFMQEGVELRPPVMSLFGREFYNSDVELRRCVADRRTVQRHAQQRGSGPYGRMGCEWCSSDDRPTPWPCPDLLDRAHAYNVTTEETTVTNPRALLDDYAKKVDIVQTEYGIFEPVEREEAAPQAFAALRAVLDLHQPDDRGTGPQCTGCATRLTFTRWPCPTVQAITTALEAT